MYTNHCMSLTLVEIALSIMMSSLNSFLASGSCTISSSAFSDKAL